LRTLTRTKEDITALSNGKENRLRARSLKAFLSEEDVPGASILMAGDGSPVFVPIAVMLKGLNGELVNGSLNELVLDKRSERGSVEDDIDDDNNSEIVKFEVILDGIPGNEGVRRRDELDWFDLDSDVDGRSDDDDDDLEFDGSRSDDFGGRVLFDELIDVDAISG